MNSIIEEVLTEKISALQAELNFANIRIQESEKNRLRLLKDADRLDTYYKPKIATRITYDAKRDL